MKNLFLLKNSKFLVLCLFLVTSCEKEVVEKIKQPEQIIETSIDSAALLSRSGTAIPNIDLLANNIAFELKNNSIGYSLKVSYKNQAYVTRSGGWARMPYDNPSKLMTCDAKYQTASVSKTITAAALIHVLSNAPNSYNMIDWPIYPYLPNTWIIGKNIDKITFRDLLTHKSGFRNIVTMGFSDANNCSYIQLKSLISKGININDKNVASYNNRNYGLLRLLIPILSKKYNVPQWNPKTNSIFESQIYEEIQEIQYADAYKDFCRKVIFSKLPSCANQTINCLNTDLFYGLNYPFPANYKNGTAFGDLTLNAGGEGWVLTTNEMHDFFNTLHYTEKILPKILTDLMKVQLLGYDVSDKTNDGIKYYWKNGIYNLSNTGGYRSLIIGFGDDIQISIMTNSPFNLQALAIKHHELWYK